MDRYLEKHFKGIYRIKADYDLSTNDFIKNENGEIDEDFGDFYIECKSSNSQKQLDQIRHAHGDNLVAYIWSNQRGDKIISEIFAIDPSLIFDIETTDAETIFWFKTKNMPIVGEILGARKRGASIAPFSVKNLPTEPYTIPKKDSDMLNRVFEIIDKKEKDSILFFLNIYKDFDKYAEQKIGKKFNVNDSLKKHTIKRKELFHKIGLWNDFVEYANEKAIEFVENQQKDRKKSNK